jgi:hypothetical protein
LTPGNAFSGACQARRVKLRSKNADSDPRLRIDPVGHLLHAKVIER